MFGCLRIVDCWHSERLSAPELIAAMVLDIKGVHRARPERDGTWMKDAFHRLALRGDLTQHTRSQFVNGGVSKEESFGLFNALDFNSVTCRLISHSVLSYSVK
jgi:hypothetical protein